MIDDNNLDFQEKLIKLISSNDLDILESRLNQLNIFNILKLSEYEIRHSNFLAWLLDPNENHKLKDLFLKKFIIKILRSYNKYDFKLDYIKLFNYDLSDLVVIREKYNVDLLLISQKNKFLIIIENKWNSRESKNQLNKYLNTISEKYPLFDIIPVYLTKYGVEPSNNKYVIISYEDVYDILDFIVNLKDIDIKVIDVIKQYYDLLKVSLMKDEEISKLCMTIYKEHKIAIDKINEYATNFDFLKICNLFSKDKNLLGLLDTLKSSRYWFLPESYLKILPKNYIDNWNVSYPICFWFLFLKNEKKIYFTIEIGPFSNQDKRKELINLLVSKLDLKDLNKKLIRVADSNEDKKYTRIYTRSIEFDEWYDDDKIIASLNKLYDEKTVYHVNNIYGVLKDFKWE